MLVSWLVLFRLLLFTMRSATLLQFGGFSPLGVCRAACGQGNRQSGKPAEEHTDAHQRADSP
jgi:hypothetical protein